jgi:hypothetical protein
MATRAEEPLWYDFIPCQFDCGRLAGVRYARWYRICEACATAHRCVGRREDDALCGQPATTSGFLEHARKAAEALKLDLSVPLCASCAAAAEAKGF